MGRYSPKNIYKILTKQIILDFNKMSDIFTSVFQKYRQIIQITDYWFFNKLANVINQLTWVSKSSKSCTHIIKDLYKTIK